MSLSVCLNITKVSAVLLCPCHNSCTPVCNYCCTLFLPGSLIATNYILHSVLTSLFSSDCDLCSCLSTTFVLLLWLSFLVPSTRSLPFSSYCSSLHTASLFFMLLLSLFLNYLSVYASLFLFLHVFCLSRIIFLLFLSSFWIYVPLLSVSFCSIAFFFPLYY